MDDIEEKETVTQAQEQADDDLELFLGLMEGAQNDESEKRKGPKSGVPGEINDSHSSSQTSDETRFFSAVGEDLDLDSTRDAVCEHDVTLSGAKSDEPLGKETISLKDRKTPELKQELSSLKNRIDQLQSELTLREVANKRPKGTARLLDAPIDFFNPPSSSDSAPLPETAIHDGDTSSDEDEINRNPGTIDRLLSEEGRKLKIALKQKQAENKTTACRGTSSQSAVSAQLLRDMGKQTGKKVATFTTSSASVFDEFFGIKVITPKVSSVAFSGFGGQRFRLSQLRPGFSPPGDLSGWLTMAVLVEKGQPRTSANGNKYSIWTVSDLRDCDKDDISVSVFLFGEAYKKHWKVSVGTALAFHSMLPMENKDDNKGKKGKGNLKFRLTDPANIVEIGHCPDFATCRGVRKGDGAPCSKWINRAHGDFCTYHIYSASKSMASKRGALQSTMSRPPKSWESKALGNQNVFYGGKIVRSQPVTKETFKKMKQPKLLSQAGAKSDKLDEDSTAEVDQNPLLARLEQPTPGALNLLKHLGSDEFSKKDWEGPSTSTQKSSATSGLKFLRQTKSPSKVCAGVGAEGSKIGGMGAKLYGNKVPQLGRGFGNSKVEGGAVGEERKKNGIRSNGAALDKAKAKALRVLKSKGPIEKVDPNAVIGSARNNVAGSKKRGLQMTNEGPPSSGRIGPNGSSPVKKRSKLGGQKLSKEEMMAIANKKSSHQDALELEEMNRQEEYFRVMEAQERIEQRATEITEVKNCRVVTCKKCEYTWHCQSDLCKREGHLIQRHTADKRYFKCKPCGKRTVAYEKLPRKGCRGCGEKDWERVGMRDERKGPSLAQESLTLTGDQPGTYEC